MPLGNVGLNATVLASVDASNFNNTTEVAQETVANGNATLLLNATTVNIYTGFASARPVGVIRQFSASCYIVFPISAGLHGMPYMRFSVDTGDDLVSNAEVIAKIDSIQTEGLNYVAFQSLVLTWPITSIANALGHPNGYTLTLLRPLKVYVPATPNITVDVGFVVSVNYTDK